jgi:hypothetical protein
MGTGTGRHETSIDGDLGNVAIVWLKGGCARWIHIRGDVVVRVRGDSPEELDDVEEEVEKPGFNSAYLDVFLEEGALSWTNWSEGEIDFGVFEEERVVVPSWADDSDIEDCRQSALQGIEEYSRVVDGMPEPLRAEMHRYLGQFRDRLAGFGLSGSASFADPTESP